MERILSLSESLKLLNPDEFILCALSGGRDSVALLHFLKERNFHLAAAHFDHHLRSNSTEDREFCEKLCREWRIPYYSGEGDVGALPGNTEANARSARYAFLEETAERIGAAVIVTAHNADDELETVLLHLTRGCGLNGLTGIRPRLGRVVRPMLQVPRAVIDAYVEENRLPFVEDATNADTTYARNRIRHQVVPVLKSINPRVVEAAAFMTQTLREDMAFLQANRGREAGEKTPVSTVYPPLKETTLLPGDSWEAALWSLTTKRVDKTPGTPPTAEAFYLRIPSVGPLSVRSRRRGDRIHPPFRTGKTVKKWFNELGVPPGEREAVPVLTVGETVVSVAGIGPSKDLLAEPGQEGLFVRWTKKREEQNP